MMSKLISWLKREWSHTVDVMHATQRCQHPLLLNIVELGTYKGYQIVQSDDLVLALTKAHKNIPNAAYAVALPNVIIVNQAFSALPKLYQDICLEHEVGHKVLNHIGGVSLTLKDYFGISDKYLKPEYEADEYSFKTFGPQVIECLKHLQTQATSHITRQLMQERIEHLVRHMKSGADYEYSSRKA